MSNYHRSYQQGGCYFFTVVTYQRTPIFADPNNIKILRAAFKHIKQHQPFDIEAIVILPDHLHCIWLLPKNDDAYSSRWREIKKYCSKRMTQYRNHRNESNVWQRRFWEHAIKDESDWKNHMDYIHYNPVKHGYVDAVKSWPWSSFKACVEKGWYEENWGEETPKEIINWNKE